MSYNCIITYHNSENKKNNKNIKNKNNNNNNDDHSCKIYNNNLIKMFNK